MTFTTVRGNKVRSASKRRYILVHDDGVRAPSVVKRSDNVQTLRKVQSGRAWWDANFSIIDTNSGDTIVSRILGRS